VTPARLAIIGRYHTHHLHSRLWQSAARHLCLRLHSIRHRRPAHRLRPCRSAASHLPFRSGLRAESQTRQFLRAPPKRWPLPLPLLLLLPSPCPWRLLLLHDAEARRPAPRLRRPCSRLADSRKKAPRPSGQHRLRRRNQPTLHRAPHRAPHRVLHLLPKGRPVRLHRRSGRSPPPDLPLRPLLRLLLPLLHLSLHLRSPRSRRRRRFLCRRRLPPRIAALLWPLLRSWLLRVRPPPQRPLLLLLLLLLLWQRRKKAPRRLSPLLCSLLVLLLLLRLLLLPPPLAPRLVVCPLLCPHAVLPLTAPSRRRRTGSSAS